MHQFSSILRKPFIVAGLRLGLRITPDALFAHLFSMVANQLLRGQDLAEAFSTLDQKVILLRVIDSNLQLALQITDGQLISHSNEPWDVCISGRFDDFQSLLHGEQDADTLFFQRKLTLQGDVETGLTIKNILDGLEYNWHSHFEDVFGKNITEKIRRLRDERLTELGV